MERQDGRSRIEKPMVDERERVEGAVPEVVGPNPIPSGSRFETSTESYAAGFPHREIMSWSVSEAIRIRAERTFTD